MVDIRAKQEGRSTPRFWWILMTTATVIVLASTGCSFVDVSEEARAVGVLKTIEEASDCVKKGEISTQTMARVAGVARNETSVAVELERIARNDAIGLAANTIVPLGPVTESGTRRFAAYFCSEN